ncbi:MAG: 1-deoxy-D-xylulose-5-phosphate reductoisomerase [Lachnospiraceae bacterium]|nr:1-deoxy-D-xylulose-5-phosphate reductoisomerase [Lachnospiraceae bacterium]
MKKIAVLGSTGSIGTQTLEVVSAYPGRFEIVSLSAGKNIDLLEKQIRIFRPKVAAVWDEKDAEKLKMRLTGVDVTILSGMDGLIEAACIPEAEIVVTAIVGMIGIRPTIAAIKAKKDIALANKETLVCAGHIIIPLVKQMGVKLLPVDSEHSAIFQCLNGEKENRIHKILLTASGGPFRGRKKEELKDIKPEDALKHPNWSMGAKITIDSSTMVNKGLEVMEAKWLFGVDYDRVQVVIQPKSIIHSMVEFEDGAVIAQLGTPDMKLPIQYALTWPERMEIKGGGRLDFAELTSIAFEKPDMVNFPALALAYEAGKRGGNIPTAFNAANEIAVAEFLGGKIGYLDIYEKISHACEKIDFIKDPDVDEIFYTQEAVCRLFD